MYQKVTKDLRESYNRNAAERETYGIESWKIEERQHFLTTLQRENKHHLLEIGAGPGRDSKFFQDHGLQVTCTDLSPEMVKLCRSKGLTAHVMDFLNLNFPPETFEAIYALNCLLHVPKKDLGGVLATIQRLLKLNGLFYLGVYGKDNFEGILEQDVYEPKRFFSFHTDEAIQNIVSQYFKIIYFKTIPRENDVRHFQSMILKRL